MRPGPGGLLALAASALVAGCVADGTDFEAFPFVAIDNTDAGNTHVTVPVGLSAYDTGPSRRVIRGPEGPEPIDEQAPRDLKSSRLTLVFPIFTYTSDGREHETRFFGPFASTIALSSAGPLGRIIGPGSVQADPFVNFGDTEPGGFSAFPFVGYDRVHLDPSDKQATKRDYGLLPLFMGGDWPLKGNYLTVAPFGGYTYGFLGRDEMHWYGFPYPFYLYSREREIESRHVLFPIINWIEGGGRSGFRVFPFYGHYTRTDLLGRLAYDRTWVLWPLLTWGTNSANQLVKDEETGELRAAPTSLFFFFPFFGRIAGPDDKNYTVLWPFFRYEEIASTNYWELRAPFPFFIMHYGDDPGLKKKGAIYTEKFRFDIWPLAGYRVRPGYIRHFVIWPIERFEARDDEWVEDQKFYFLPFVTYHHHKEKATQEDYQRTRLWPFALYRRGVKGDVELHALAPILWDDPQGFERIIFPFFRLYEYKRTASGGTYHRFLLGLAATRSEPEREGVTEGYSRLSLLFGMFQYRSGGTTPEQSGRRGLRFFYLPEITWGGSEK